MAKNIQTSGQITDQTTGAYNFDEFQKDTLTRPRDKAWGNWKSWKDAKFGEKVQGYIRDVFYRPESELEGQKFAAQRGITLEQVDGMLINVAIKSLPFVLAHTDNLRLGDPLTIVYESDGEKKSKLMNPPKNYGFYGRNLPENEGNKTVKELYEEDRRAGGTKEEDVRTDAEEDDDAGSDDVTVVPENGSEPF